METHLKDIKIQDEAAVQKPKAKDGAKTRLRDAKLAIEHDYLRVLIDVVTPKEWKAIISKAKTQAKQGDYRARNFLAEKLLPPDMTILELLAETRSSAEIVEAFKPHVVKRR